MIFFALTKPKKKVTTIITIALLAVLLLGVIPYGYAYLNELGALAEYTAVEEERINPDPIVVIEEEVAEYIEYESTFGEALQRLIYGDELLIEIP